GVVTGGKETQFKPGRLPHNYKPVGTERVNADGYVDIKIQDGNAQKNWKGKHLVVWEERHGPVPKGHAVIFGDGNRRNFEPSNLILVSRQQLAVLNKKNLIQNSAELTKTGIIIADIFRKISDRKADTRRRKGV
ncbi:MAG: HNH endonuclease signature motif containing protein, partial [Candidatus Desulforudaceae bacterium]